MEMTSKDFTCYDTTQITVLLLCHVTITYFCILRLTSRFEYQVAKGDVSAMMYAFV